MQTGMATYKNNNINFPICHPKKYIFLNDQNSGTTEQFFLL